MPTPIAHDPQAQPPLIVRQYGQLSAVSTERDTHLQWRGDVAYATAMPFAPWLLALPACLLIAVVQALASGGASWPAATFARSILVHTLLVCVPSWLVVFAAMRGLLWLYGRLVRTSMVLTPSGVACHRQTPFGTTALLPAGSALAEVHEDELVEHIRTGATRHTLARQHCVCVHTTTHAGLELGHGLDHEGRRVLVWMLSQRATRRV